MIERGELVGESLNAQHVLLGHRLDLPRRLVQRTEPPGVSMMPVDTAVLRMDVEFDAPTDYGDPEVEVDGDAVATFDRDLRLDGNTPAQQGVKKDQQFIGGEMSRRSSSC